MCGSPDATNDFSRHLYYAFSSTTPECCSLPPHGKLDTSILTCWQNCYFMTSPRGGSRRRAIEYTCTIKNRAFIHFLVNWPFGRQQCVQYSTLLFCCWMKNNSPLCLIWLGHKARDVKKCFWKFWMELMAHASSSRTIEWSCHMLWECIVKRTN